MKHYYLAFNIYNSHSYDIGTAVLTELTNLAKACNTLDDLKNGLYKYICFIRELGTKSTCYHSDNSIVFISPIKLNHISHVQKICKQLESMGMFNTAISHGKGKLVYTTIDRNISKFVIKSVAWTNSSNTIFDEHQLLFLFLIDKKIEQNLNKILREAGACNYRHPTADISNLFDPYTIIENHD